MPSWKKVAVSGSDASFNSLYVTNAVTASIFSGSFIGDGAGLTNLTYGDFATASFTTQATWSFAHNIGYQYVAIEVFDQNNFIVIPSAIKIIDSNNVDIYFTSPQSGTALATLGTGVVTTSGGTANTSSLLVTASAANNVITFTKGNGSTFNVTVDTGSVNLTGYTTTSSFNAFTSSYNTGSFTGSFIGDGSELTGIVSSKWTGSNPISRQSDVEITGSLRVTGGVTASLFGTASWANNALTASYVQLAQTASYVLNAVSSSYASTASYVILAQTASYVETAQTASYVLQAVSASFATSASWAPSLPTFPYTGSALITGSLGITGSLNITSSTPTTLLTVGANTLVVTGSRIGIGTETPSTLLHVVGNYSGSLDNLIPQMLFQNSNTTPSTNKTAIVRVNVGTGYGGGYPEVWLESQQTSGGAGLTKLRTVSNSPLIFYTNDTERVRITETGNVGIRKTTTNANLDISGSTIITGSLIVTEGITGSLQGTASYAVNALSASYAPVFPFTGSAIITGSLVVTGSITSTQNIVASQNITASRAFISSSNGTVSGSSLTVYGSGSAQPVFTVQGSSGELFSVTDSLTGSLFSVNDISGLPILEVFSDNTTLIGNYLDPMLITTAKVTQTNSGSFTVYSLPTASYDTAFFEYSVRSGSNARAGTIMAIQSGSSVNFTETTTTDFGNTTAVSFTVIVTGSNMALTGSSTSGAWTIKSIVRGL